MTKKQINNTMTPQLQNSETPMTISQWYTSLTQSNNDNNKQNNKQP